MADYNNQRLFFFSSYVIIIVLLILVNLNPVQYRNNRIAVDLVKIYPQNGNGTFAMVIGPLGACATLDGTSWQCSTSFKYNIPGLPDIQGFFRPPTAAIAGFMITSTLLSAFFFPCHIYTHWGIHAREEWIWHRLSAWTGLLAESIGLGTTVYIRLMLNQGNKAFNYSRTELSWVLGPLSGDAQLSNGFNFFWAIYAFQGFLVLHTIIASKSDSRRKPAPSPSGPLIVTPVQQVKIGSEINWMETVLQTAAKFTENILKSTDLTKTPTSPARSRPPLFL